MLGNQFVARTHATHDPTDTSRAHKETFYNEIQLTQQKEEKV